MPPVKIVDGGTYNPVDIIAGIFPEVLVFDGNLGIVQVL